MRRTVGDRKPMRRDADAARQRELLTALGRHGRPGDRIYLSGGSSAIELGWRAFTHDVDVRLDVGDDVPILRAIRDLKEVLDLNVELAGPLDFLPEPDGWRDRSPFVGRFGAIDVYHTDFAVQALAKLERGLERDLSDVRAMLDRELTTQAAIAAVFAAVRADLYRFPAIDEDVLADTVARWTADPPGGA